MVEGAAVAVAAAVHERREEAVAEVAVGEVQLDHAEARGDGPPRRGGEGLSHAADLRDGQLVRHRAVVVEAPGGGADGHPAAFRAAARRRSASGATAGAARPSRRRAPAECRAPRRARPRTRRGGAAAPRARPPRGPGSGA